MPERETELAARLHQAKQRVAGNAAVTVIVLPEISRLMTKRRLALGITVAAAIFSKAA